MIQSMTAFARFQHTGKWGGAACELRSINHRYLEMVVRLPENLHALEAPIRECIRRYLKRGKIECHIRYQPGDVTGSDILINKHLAKQLCMANEAISEISTNSASPSTMEILKWPGIIQMAELDFEAIEDEVLKILEKSLEDLVKSREREGGELKELFLQRMDAMKNELAKVKQKLPQILKEQRERIMTRFKDAKLEMDSNRLEQEMVMFAQKIDVTEELERLDAHISEVRRVLKQGGMVGRRLDFLMQELNREANTLGAKSVDVETTRSSVELKVLIEQVREQVQNVE